MVGIVKESVICILIDFKNEGLIKIEGGSIFIFVVDKLEVMLNQGKVVQ